jgi:hypothetical protein
VYVLLSAADGGRWGEAKIDRATGSLRGLTVLRIPTTPASTAEHRVALDATDFTGTPIIDRAPFDLTPDDDPRTEAIEFATTPAIAMQGADLLLWLCPGEVVRWIASGEVRLGLDAEDEIVAIGVHEGQARGPVS